MTDVDLPADDDLLSKLDQADAAIGETATDAMPDLRPGAVARLWRIVVALKERAEQLEARTPVNVVPASELPGNAPAGTLWRTTTSGDLYLGNGPNRPLSRFTPAA